MNNANKIIQIACAMLFTSLVVFSPTPSIAADVNPLAQKEKMIRDRFERLEDRIFRLRDQLSEVEPENAAKLTRALQRAGELGLADKLEAIVEMLHDSSALQDAVDAQDAWVEDVDLLLAILLARDSENEERKGEIERLLEYKQEIGKILSQQKDLRDETAQSSLGKRMSQQLDQAIRRVDELLKRQKEISKETDSMQATEKSPGMANQQNDLSRDTKQLAEDVQRLAQSNAEESKDSQSQEEARSQAMDAAKSLQGGSESMSKAGQSMKQGQNQSAQKQQQNAEEALQKAREQLQKAKERLEEQSAPENMAEEQEKLAEKTGDLAEKMEQDGSESSESGGQGEQGEESQSGEKSSSTPGTQNLQKAQGEMKGASKGLQEDKPQEAVEKQDKAIEQLEEAQKALEEELNKLRKEERGEMLRDLEVRFREMLSKQRAINDATVVLDDFGKSNFKREHKLQIADLSAQENKLSQQAATCLHILEEDATTVIFPHVVEQVSQDMANVAGRLAELKVGSLTQAIEQEIVETLEQLLGAIQQMQQENEQGDSQQGKQGSNEDQSLLPTSAELKLLRASQFRVNTRTDAIADAIEEGTESMHTGAIALHQTAGRQKECAVMATELRDRQELPK